MSLLTPAPSDEKVAGLTFATADEPVAPAPAVEGVQPGTPEGSEAGVPAGLPTEPAITQEHLAAMDHSDPHKRRVDFILTLVLIAIVAVVMLTFTG